MATRNLFIPITKIDVETRTVFGQMTAEAVDAAKEIWDYDGSKPYFEAWTAKAEKNSGGKSLGNLRSMHQPISAGKLTQFVMDDATKTVEIAAKVVDDAEWTKVQEGVYTGFSQGGKYIKRWKDPTDPTKTRYISDPVEVSLVDVPCLASALLEVGKADGVEKKAFHPWAPTNDEILDKAMALSGDEAHKGKALPDLMDLARDALEAEYIAKVMGGDDTDLPALEDAPAAEVGKAAETPATEAPEGAEPAPADKAATPEAEPEPVDWTVKQRQDWLAPDGKAFATKAEAVAHTEALKLLDKNGSPLAAAIAKAKAAAAVEAEPADPDAAKAALVEAQGALKATMVEVDDAEKALRQLVDGDGETVGKRNLYSVSRLADILSSLKGTIGGNDSYYYGEGSGAPDDAKVTAQLIAGFKTLGEALVTMAKEEVASAVASMKPGGAKVTAKADQPELAKMLEEVGAGEEPLVAKMGGLDAEVPPVAADDAVKALTAENDALKAEIAKALPGIEELGTTVTKLVGDLAAAQDQIRKLGEAPAPMPVLAPGTGIVEKAGTEPAAVTAAMAPALLKQLVDALGLEAVRDAVFKAAVTNPIRLGG